MGWFGIQLDAGSYFCMRDKVFWWRVIAAASGGCLGVLWSVQYTVCLLKQNTSNWILDLLHHFSPLSSLCQKGSVAGRAQINLFCWKWERYSRKHTHTNTPLAVWKINKKCTQAQLEERRHLLPLCCSLLLKRVRYWNDALVLKIYTTVSFIKCSPNELYDHQPFWQETLFSHFGVGVLGRVFGEGCWHQFYLQWRSSLLSLSSISLKHPFIVLWGWQTLDAVLPWKLF